MVKKSGGSEKSKKHGCTLGLIFLALCCSGCAGSSTEAESGMEAKQETEAETGREVERGTEAEPGSEAEQGEGAEAGTEADTEGKAEKEEIMLKQGYKGLDHTNPLMTQSFGADPYAMVYGDRVYIYMTGDTFEYDGEGNIKENTYGQIRQIRVISTDDMVNFTDHGAVLAASDAGAAKWAHNSWAPAAAWKEIDGKPRFFLYFADAGGGIGVLQSDSPTGPFQDPLGKALISRQTPNCADVLWLFDPAVLTDDDGRAYLYFGGGVPEGRQADPGTGRVVELGEDMISIVGEPRRIDIPYLFEDSGIHKAGDKYYYTYCTNWQVDEEGTAKYGFRSGEIACMVSDSPMGPFEYKETILKNPGGTFGLYGNNHHCVFRFRENWYITYHTRVLEKAMGVEKGYRCTHIDGFTMQEDGTIGTIRQTLKGREQLKYVNPYEENRAANMAVMGGIQCIPADETAREFGSGNMAVGDIDAGDFVKVQGVDFAGEGASRIVVTVRNASGGEGSIEIRLDGPEGEVIGSVPVSGAAGDVFAECGADVKPVGGVHDLFFIFSGKGYEVETWRFIQ